MDSRPAFGAARQQRPPWNASRGGSSVVDPAYEWWAPARPLPGDSQEQTRLRLSSAQALHRVPRDPRYFNPDREMQWVGTSPLNTRYIPDFDVMGEHINCVHQIEPFISRPAGKARADHVAHRLSLGKRTSPLLSYNSIGWNRRHYEPVPDASLANANRPAFGSGTAMSHEDLRNASFASRQSSISRPASRSFSGASDGSPVPPLTPDEREREYL